MHFSRLAIAALCSLATANPVPEPEASVNIVNPDIAGTASAVKDSYLVVMKGGVSDSTCDKYEKSVHKKLGKGVKDKYKIDGFKAYHLETDKAGLAKVASDPLVSNEANLDIDVVKTNKNRLHMSKLMV
jgi:hypothetical protein